MHPVLIAKMIVTHLLSIYSANQYKDLQFKVYSYEPCVMEINHKLIHNTKLYLLGGKRGSF